MDQQVRSCRRPVFLVHPLFLLAAGRMDNRQTTSCEAGSVFRMFRKAMLPSSTMLPAISMSSLFRYTVMLLECTPQLSVTRLLITSQCSIP